MLEPEVPRGPSSQGARYPSLDFRPCPSSCHPSGTVGGRGRQQVWPLHWRSGPWARALPSRLEHPWSACGCTSIPGLAGASLILTPNLDQCPRMSAAFVKNKTHHYSERKENNCRVKPLHLCTFCKGPFRVSVSVEAPRPPHCPGRPPALSPDEPAMR